MGRVRCAAAAGLVLAAVLAAPAAAGGGELPVELHGFLLGTVSSRTTGLRPPGGEGGAFVLGEERLRLDLSGATRSGAAFSLVKLDLVHDAVANRFDDDLREAYGGYASGPLDFRIGRQIVTWGVGDLFFVHDVFPKDWESFFSGRPMEYLKLGVDAVRLRVSSSLVNAELVAIPLFTPDRLPSPRRFFLFDPSATAPEQREREPATRLANVEEAVRLYREGAGFDVSLYVYRGFWRTPGVRFDAAGVATRFFPPLSVYGASVQGNVDRGVLSGEVGYYDSRDDRGGSNPSMPNSQWRLLGGYQREIWSDFVAGIQGYGEIMTDYGAYRGSLPPGAPRQDRLRAVSSVRLTQLLDYQTWRLSWFAAYSPTDDDYFLQPEVSYRVTDSIGLTFGANVFGGRSRSTFFGQLARDDNVFVAARFDF